MNPLTASFSQSSGRPRSSATSAAAVTTASPAYLLAMKLMAMRFGKDEEDIELLLRECGITKASDALALLARLYPYQKPPSRLACS